MGNDQPMTTSREFWYAPSLGVNLISIVDDPQSGKQLFTATDLSIADPDPSLFNPPRGLYPSKTSAANSNRQGPRLSFTRLLN